MADDLPQRRCFRPQPGWLVLALLAVEGFLFLSERFHWFAFNRHKGWTVLIAVAVVGAAILLMLLWFAIALLLRRRFQFSLRSLLVLVVAVALPCSWLAVARARAQRQRDAVAEMNKQLIGYDDLRFMWGSLIPPPRIMYDWEDVTGNFLPASQLHEPAWLRNVLGVDFFSEVVSVNLSTDVYAAIRPQERFLADKRRSIDLEVKLEPIMDDSLEAIKGWTQLMVLILDGRHVTDAGLEKIKGLTQLMQLYLVNTQITDAGLEQIKGLTQLESLDLTNTQVTDIGLEHLKSLTQLKHISLHGTRVTTNGVKKLQQALPDCIFFR